ncbi:MAG TPA: malto-oligosyltrehalose synthase [Pirellulales bacterium]|nr:malto-oligosyltrehalose synthase [Pirellulales bacterium]
MISRQQPVRVPIATYRLQFNSRFRLSDARALVDYLHELGASDAYVSPLFHSCDQSAHGYDVVDHDSIDPEIGTDDDFRELAEALRRRGMGILMDVVPNHMGISDANNRLWQDVLENGPSSPYADFFDIDWDTPERTLKHKVLLPFLGDQYGKVLENQELHLRFTAGRFYVEYHDHRFPLNPQSWTQVLELAQRRLAGRLPPDDPHAMELESIVIALGNLAPLDERDPERVHQRQLERQVVPRRLCDLLETNVSVREALGEAVTEFNGRAGDPRSFDRLEALLAEQAYRLCHWRVAADEINYRRFFDVNELAAIRVEDPRVFQAVHRLLFEFVGEGWVTGLRIDHPDGLFDPRQYFDQLQDEFRRTAERRSGAATDDEPRHTSDRLYVVAEKILVSDETLPDDWAVHGTTGYDYLNLANGLFVDGRAADAMRSLYGRFTGKFTRFPDVAYAGKRAILDASMASELHVLSRRLDRIAEQHRYSRDFTHSSLRRALREVIACFPVYRTYVRPDSEPVGEQDRRRTKSALRLARRRNPELNASLFNFLGSVLLLEHPDQLDGAQRHERREFVLRFQQLTGPVMAKGLEDTAFYRDYPLLSLLEVGGDPEQFGTPVEHFHRRNADRLANWPHSLLASSTHDTKRGEDARARINVVSEVPAQWEQSIERWRQQNLKRKSELDGTLVPDGNEEYLFYQTLVGTWPLGPLNADGRSVFIGRIQQFMSKALREAKLNTSWTNPNDEYEQAVSHFVAAVLEPGADNEFLGDFERFHAPLALAGMRNALAQVLLKVCSPGVPDFYQGTEWWDFSLVDPDNRRPVDFGSRAAALAALKTRARGDLPRLMPDLLATWRDGRVKQFLTSQALNFRRRHHELFGEGDYVALDSQGNSAECICAFARVLGEYGAMIVVPRLTLPLGADDGPLWRDDAWSDTAVRLPWLVAGCRNVLTGESHSQIDAGRGGVALRVADVLRHFPVALVEFTRS